MLVAKPMLKDRLKSLLIRATQKIMNLLARDAAPLLLALDRILVMAPHPDDETLGCGGLILRARELGHHVRIVVVSDGSQGTKASSRPEANLVEERQKEAREAAARLGIEPDDIVFLNLPDGNLTALASNLDTKLAEQILNFEPHLVLSPYIKENHPDHRALAESAARLRKQDKANREWVEYPVWFWPQGAVQYLLPPPKTQECLLKLDISSVRLKKKHALAAYRSQLPITDENRAETNYFQPLTLTASFLGRYEYYISLGRSSKNGL